MKQKINKEVLEMGIFKRKGSLEKEVQKQLKKIEQQCNMLDQLQAKQIAEWGKR